MVYTFEIKGSVIPAETSSTDDIEGFSVQQPVGLQLLEPGVCACALRVITHPESCVLVVTGAAG